MTLTNQKLPKNLVVCEETQRARVVALQQISKMPALAAPKVVSPFIRFCRWSALIVGVGYGSYRYRYLSRKEEKLQVVQTKLKEERAAQLAVEKKQALEKEMYTLGVETGVVKPSSS